MHDDVLLQRASVTQFLEEGGRVRGAAHGVDHEVGDQFPAVGAVPIGDTNSRHPAAIERRGQSGHVVAVDDRDVVESLQAPPNMAFEERPAGLVHRDALVVVGPLPGAQYQNVSRSITVTSR